MAKPRAIVSIDFGTSFSGFAYVIPSKDVRDVKVEFCFDWQDQGKIFLDYPKTISTLKLDSNPALWGWPAEMALGNKNFKLFLDEAALKKYNDAAVSKLQPLPVPVEEAVGTYLTFLSQAALSKLKEKEKGVAPDQIQWVFTIPVMWSDDALKRMKRAVHKAGLDTSKFPVIYLPEPDAASVACLDSASKALDFGARYMVVDIGGGTTDIVVHEIGAKTADKKSMREFSRAHGELCGGLLVDDAFLREAYSEYPELKEIEKTTPALIFAMKRDWERAKRAFNGSGSITVNFPHKLSMKIRQMRGDDDDDDDPDEKDLPKMELSAGKVKEIFDVVVNKIKALMEEQLKKVPMIKGVFMAGGFSKSPYLMKSIAETFGARVKIIHFGSPESAILQGAAMYGENPSIFSARCAKFTYGLELLSPPKYGDPKDAEIMGHNGIRYVRKFLPFIYQGQEIPNNHIESQDIFLGSVTDEAVFRVFKVDSEDPDFIRSSDEKSGKTIHLGDVKFKGKLTELEKGFRVNMFIGASDIEVTVMMIATGETIPLAITYE